MIFDTSKPLEKNKAISRFNALIEKGNIIDITAKRGKKTVKQNRYVHVLFCLYAIEFGYTLRESKTLMKRSCPFMIYEKNDKKFLRGIGELDTKELADFIDWFRVYSAMCGCYLPTPDEYRLNRYMIDNEITRHKQYL